MERDKTIRRNGGSPLFSLTRKFSELSLNCIRGVTQLHEQATKENSKLTEIAITRILSIRTPVETFLSLYFA